MIKIYCDGACQGNPGKAGSGIAVYHDKQQPILYTGGYVAKGTNNTAELLALHESLLLAQNISEQVTIISDSQYSIDCITNWAYSWKAKNWIKKGGPIKNLKIIKEAHFLYENLKQRVSIEWVKGHSGVKGNELADRMAETAIRNKVVGFSEYSYTNVKPLLEEGFVGASANISESKPHKTQKTKPAPKEIMKNNHEKIWVPTGELGTFIEKDLDFAARLRESDDTTIQILVAQDNSMHRSFKKGDIVFVEIYRDISKATIDDGDIIVFTEGAKSTKEEAFVFYRAHINRDAGIYASRVDSGNIKSLGDYETEEDIVKDADGKVIGVLSKYTQERK